MSVVLNYGGGRQTVATCVLVERELLPLPDLFLMADTGRENPSTWAYLASYVQPMLARLGRQVTVIGRETAPAVTYGADDKPLIPVFTRDAKGDGKMSPFCSGQWKRDRMLQWLTANNYPKGERWIGFSANERKRINRFLQSDRQDGWLYRFPLAEMLLDTDACLAVVKKRGWPEPPISSCWMCPHKKNDEWKSIKNEHPELWEAACGMDDEMREQDLFRGGRGVWLHHSRVPLRDADLTYHESNEVVRQCSLGMCFV